MHRLSHPASGICLQPTPMPPIAAAFTRCLHASSSHAPAVCCSGRSSELATSLPAFGASVSSRRSLRQCGAPFASQSRHQRSDTTSACHAHALAVEAVSSAVASEGAAAVATSAAASPFVSMFAVLLGYACLAGSCFRSVPQIVKVVKRGSIEGLSVMSNFAELMCYTVTTAYNANQGYPFNAYGEIFACWVQDIVLVALIIKHSNINRAAALVGAVVFAAVCAFMFTGGVPIKILGYMHLSTIFVMAGFARLPQILLNHRRGSSGVLSLTTCILNVAGNSIRIFTTLVVTHDPLILAGCVTQGTLNSILLYQTLRTRMTERRKARQLVTAGGGNVPTSSPAFIGPQLA